MTIYAVETAEQAFSATKFMSEAFDRNPFRLIGLDTEFYGGGYPDSTLTHMTLSTEGYDFVFELTKPGVMVATEEGWATSKLHRIIFATHYGQEDIMLLMRAGCRIDYIWDSGIIANHLGLINTGLKELAVDYDLIQPDAPPVSSYAQLLKTIIPIAEQGQYFKKNGDVAQAYQLHLAEGDNRIKVLAYAAQDGTLTQALCHHLRDLVLPTIYDQHSLEIILTAQFESAILLARNNARGYNIDTKTLNALVSEIADEVGELDVTGRELVREAMGWDRVPDENPLAAFLPKSKPEQIEMFPAPLGVPHTPFPAIVLGRHGATIAKPEPKNDGIDAEHDVHVAQHDRPAHDPVSLADAGLGGPVVDRGCPEPASPGDSPEEAKETVTGGVG